MDSNKRARCAAARNIHECVLDIKEALTTVSDDLSVTCGLKKFLIVDGKEHPSVTQYLEACPDNKFLHEKHALHVEIRRQQIPDQIRSGMSSRLNAMADMYFKDQDRLRDITSLRELDWIRRFLSDLTFICPICLEKASVTTSGFTSWIECGHKMHLQCYRKYVTEHHSKRIQTCPECRRLEDAGMDLCSDSESDSESEPVDYHTPPDIDGDLQFLRSAFPQRLRFVGDLSDPDFKNLNEFALSPEWRMFKDRIKTARDLCEETDWAASRFKNSQLSSSASFSRFNEMVHLLASFHRLRLSIQAIPNIGPSTVQ